MDRSPCCGHTPSARCAPWRKPPACGTCGWPATRSFAWRWSRERDVDERVDVLIIGGGPAGAATALALARRGGGVGPRGRARFPREKLCGDFLHPLGTAALERLGLLDEVLPRAQVLRGLLIVSPQGREVFARFAGGAGLSLSRAVLDETILRAAQRAGAAIGGMCPPTTGPWQPACSSARTGSTPVSPWRPGCATAPGAAGATLWGSTSAGCRGATGSGGGTSGGGGGAGGSSVP